jgi:hypothetical protein
MQPQVIRRAHSLPSTPVQVFDYCRSHDALPRKNALLQTLLEHISVAASKARDADIDRASVILTPQDSV